MKNKILLLSSLALVAVAVAGCNKKGEDEKPADETVNMLPVRIDSIYDGKLASYDEYTYDESGRIKKEKTYVSKDEVQNEFYNKIVREYEYNSLGKLSKEVKSFYTESGIFSNSDTIEYLEFDEKGNYKKMTSTYKEDGDSETAIYVYSYEYDSITKVMLSVIENNQFASTWERKTYTYDGKGRQISETISSSDDGDTYNDEMRYNTTYVGDTDLVSTFVTEMCVGASFEESGKVVYTYNAENKETCIEYFSEGILHSKNEITYLAGSVKTVSTAYYGTTPIFTVYFDNYDQYGRMTEGLMYSDLEDPTVLPEVPSGREVYYY